MVIKSYLPGKRGKTGMEYSPPLAGYGPAAPLVQDNVTRPVSSSANITHDTILNVQPNERDFQYL
jgi:hypothetical protein